MIYYDFLDNYGTVEKELRSLDFTGTTNPVDGVLYPDLAIVPAHISGVIDRNLQALYPEYSKKFQFARLSVEGVEAPHRVHNDLSMAEYTSLVYLSDEGGTSICSHRRLGFGNQPTDGEEMQAWQQDVNDDDAWRVDFYIPAERNKAVVYPGGWMHRSEPARGFGVDSSDGRLVVVTFFDA